MNNQYFRNSVLFAPFVLTLSIGLLFFLSWQLIDDEQVQMVLAAGILALLFLLRGLRMQHFRVLFIFLVTYLSFSYFVWRCTQTLSYHDPVSFVFAILLFVAELHGFVLLGLSNFTNIKPLYRKSVPLPANEREWPTVDVFIPTYNEDISIVETTALAALQIDWPKDKLRIYVLDDGGTEARLHHADPAIAATASQRRDALGALCRRHGITYLAREKNVHAKAGNLNAGLQCSSGALILILDADHVPASDILKRTAGVFLTDHRLFLVQTPHFFGNPDPVEKNLRTFSVMPGENEMFYHGVQLGLDNWNAAFFCGSAAVLRRRALEECGGFSGQSITEDAETALTLHAAGYHSAYIDRPMVCGLACESIPAFLQQRCRWGMGMVQIFLLKNPLFLRGLTFPQRICYLSSCFYWLFPFSRLFFLLSPLLFLLFGLKIYDTTGTQFLIFALPHLIGGQLLHSYLFGRLRWSFIGDIYEIIQSIPLLPALIGTMLRPRAPIFKVTSKGERLEADHLSPFARPYVYLLLINIAALVAGWFRASASGAFASAAITMGWAALNSLFLLACVGVMLERRQLRAFPRLPAFDSVTFTHGGHTWIGRLFNLSNTGAGFHIQADSQRVLPHFDGESILTVRDRSGQLLHLHGRVCNGRHTRDGFEIGFHFEPRDDAETLARIRFVYGDSERWTAFQQSRHRNKGILSALVFVLRIGSLSALEYFGHWVLRLLGGARSGRPPVFSIRSANSSTTPP
ncbi:cellulose synthase, partial [Termitidicoccus mucosus]